MGVAETFNREFNKTMRGYSPSEVDAAVDALLRYSTDLEEANAEFEIANNDLIDERAALLEANGNLTAENASIRESSKKIEAAYNDLKERFGEARDLVVNAKKRASDIISAAEKSAAQIVSDAEKDAVSKSAEICREKEAYLDELDSQISMKKARIDKLEACFSELLSRVKTQIENVQILVGGISPDADYSDIPDVSEIAPYVPSSEIELDDVIAADAVIDNAIEADVDDTAEIEEIFVGSDKPQEKPIAEQRSGSTYIDFNSIEFGNVTPVDAAEQGKAFEKDDNAHKFSSLGPIWTADKPRDQQTNSQIMSSVNQINDRVKARKNNKPHIN